MKAPCKDCVKREIGCHSNCNKYKKWKSKQKSRDKEEVEYVGYLEGTMKRMKGSSRWA